MGGGATKQKLNIRSSTEAELVSVNALPQVLCKRQLLVEKGFRDTDPVIYQDNSQYCWKNMVEVQVASELATLMFVTIL